MDEDKLISQVADIVAYNTINDMNNLGKPKKDESLAYFYYLLSFLVDRPYWLCDCQLDLIKMYINKSCSSCQ